MNKEKNKIIQARYRQKHRKIINAKHKIWYQNNKEQIVLKNKEYLEKHPEKRKATTKKYYETHKEIHLKRCSDYRAQPGTTEKRRLWAIENRKKPEVKARLKIQRAKYVKSEKGKLKLLEYSKKRKSYFDKYRKTLNRKITVRNSKHKRRTKTQNSDVTSKWLKSLFEKTQICELCNKEMENNGSYPNGKHLDHITPIHIGGGHKRNNVRYICAECNISRPKDGSDNLQLVINI